MSDLNQLKTDNWPVIMIGWGGVHICRIYIAGQSYKLEKRLKLKHLTQLKISSLPTLAVTREKYFPFLDISLSKNQN